MENTIANPNPIQVIGRVSECVRRLMEAGLTYEALQRPIDDPRMREHLVYFWLSNGFEPMTSQIRAREIMGKNFFCIMEAMRCFGIIPTREQLASLEKIPFSEAVLEELKNTHVLVAVFPLSILEIRGKVERELFYSYGHEDAAWYNKKESFAKKCGKVSWQLVRKTPVDNSTLKNWQEQQALFGKDDEVPTAQVMVYTIIGHYLATGERLFENVYVRTSSVDSNSFRVYVGDFDLRGLDVDNDWVDDNDDYLGVSSARKPTQ